MDEKEIKLLLESWFDKDAFDGFYEGEHKVSALDTTELHGVLYHIFSEGSFSVKSKLVWAAGSDYLSQDEYKSYVDTINISGHINSGTKSVDYNVLHTAGKITIKIGKEYDVSEGF